MICLFLKGDSFDGCVSGARRIDFGFPYDYNSIMHYSRVTWGDQVTHSDTKIINSNFAGFRGRGEPPPSSCPRAKPHAWYNESMIYFYIKKLNLFSLIYQGNKHLSDLDISKLNSAYGCPRRQSRGRGKGDSCNRHLAGAEGGRVRLDGARDDGCRVLVTVPEGSAVVLQFQVVPFLDSVMVRRCFGSKSAH